MPSITGFHHVAINAADFDRSLGFYCGVLGLREKITWGQAPHRAVMLHAGDDRHLEIFEKSAAGQAGPSPLIHFALRTDDCTAMLEQVRAAGMNITMEATTVQIDSPRGRVPVRIAFFEGPDREVVELFESGEL
ncbi:MAG: hypothetical protein Fur0032_22740 [Terrimicrobiaceae bacterium]